jgi:hypothetical protein
MRISVNLHQRSLSRRSTISFTTYLYLSGTTFFTLGLGDVTPLQKEQDGRSFVPPPVLYCSLSSTNVLRHERVERCMIHHEYGLPLVGLL